MKTRCPECSTEFDVTPAQLNARSGKVRCGVCSTVFNAFDHAVEDEPDFPVLQAGTRRANTAAAAPTEIAAEDEDFRIQYDRPVERDRARYAERSVSARERQSDREPEFAEDDDWTSQRPLRVENEEADERAPSERFSAGTPSLSGSGAYYHEGRDHRRRSRAPEVVVEGQYRRRVQRDTEYDDPEHSNGSGLVWFLAVIFGLIVLFAQGAIVFRNQIANVAPNLRPQLVQLCSFVGCQVGYTRSARNLAILKPALRQANKPGLAPDTRAFTLHAVIRNNDTIDQPWPSLVLSLKDSSDSVSARRIISPEDYLLPDARSRSFKPRDEVAIDLPITASRTQVAGFELSLFYP